MGKRGRIAVIVEGAKREGTYLKALQKSDFPSKNVDLFCLPAGKNIYALWKQMREDAFETDIIEVIRECGGKVEKQLEGLRRGSFEEIYLLFDFDPQQNNLALEEGAGFEDVLRGMMRTFDNETEMGKLYISYPMVEALRDITDWSCKPYSQCAVPVEKLSKEYKRLSGDKNPRADLRKYDDSIWEMLTAIFLTRCKCLFRPEPELKDEEVYAWYKAALSQEAILEKELEYLHARNAVFVLSAFPAMLLDYFRADRFLTLADSLGKAVRPACAGEGAFGA